MRARVCVTGRVQGVYFRAETQLRAEGAGVSGWVRNAADGSVEAVFEGDAGSVEHLIAWCRLGPRGARVDGVEVSYEAPHGETGFRIVP
ncbi:MAG: acylphosphatase [Gaiellales bacterium]